MSDVISSKQWYGANNIVCCVC